MKEILFRAAERTKTAVTLVANRPMQIPRSKFISFIKVGSGADVADDEIVKQMSAGDLVITADIPLAAQVIDKEGHALNPRGELYTTENIRERLGIRDFMDELRASGIDTGGPPALNKNDRQNFANGLDRFLTQHMH
jgi:uncharacterized protein YaiI (UPF0178 family)